MYATTNNSNGFTNRIDMIEIGLIALIVIEIAVVILIIKDAEL